MCHSRIMYFDELANVRRHCSLLILIDDVMTLVGAKRRISWCSAKTDLVLILAMLLAAPGDVRAAVRGDELPGYHGTLVLGAGHVEGLSGDVLTAGHGARRDLARCGVHPDAGTRAAGVAGGRAEHRGRWR